MSSTVVRDSPLSPCNNQVVTSAATGRWDDTFPVNNHPCKTVFCKKKSRLLPLGSSERAAIRSWVRGAASAPHSPHGNFRAQDLYPDPCLRDAALKSFAQLT